MCRKVLHNVAEKIDMGDANLARLLKK